MGVFSAYWNGGWLPAPDLRIGLDDSGFLLGTTVTERLRTFHGEVFRLEEHMKRMRHSLEIVGLDAESIFREIAQIIPEFVSRNRGLVDPDDDLSIVAFATPGPIGAGRPTVCVHGYPLPFHTWAAHYDQGLAVMISSIRQVPPNCWPAELKCRSRMHFYLADREAAARRPGSRAILLDQHGYVAEATTANMVVYRSDEGLVSPPPEHILWGVSLTVVEELAAQLGIPLNRRQLTVEELCGADEAMLASTSICALPVVECEGQAIGDGRPGPIYRQLMATWSALVGVDIAEQARRCAVRRRS
jgi:branched-subunit amino acid aminotransferase/4-amino-4-deoxychorismate lyase